MSGLAAIRLPPLPPSPEAILSFIRAAGSDHASCAVADRLSERFGAADLEEALWSRRVAAETSCAPLCVDVRIPFCEPPCCCCDRSTVVTRRHERAAPYVAALDREVGLVVDQIGACRSVSRLHLGGASPTFLSEAELAELMGMLRRNFFLVPEAELSIDVDPRTVDAKRLAHLRSIGFNRIGLGVVDFDAPVHKAFEPEHLFELVRELVAAARTLGGMSIDVDLVYGLPGQTPESLRRTVAQVVALRPDRIALHANAPLPARPKGEARADGAELPPEPQRAQMLADALSVFLAEGYEGLGIDQFALPGDALAIARQEGRLHWNVHGYSTHPEDDLIGLGVAAIGDVGDCLYQNARTLRAYYAALDDNRLPVHRGHVLDADDRARRDIIEALMGRSRVDFADILARHGVDVPIALAEDVVRLAPLAALGLVELRGDGIRIAPCGWYAARAIALMFDRPAQLQSNGEHSSHARESAAPLKRQRPPARRPQSGPPIR